MNWRIIMALLLAGSMASAECAPDNGDCADCGDYYTSSFGKPMEGGR